MAWKIDAFSIRWTNIYSYAFPPFRLILRCLKNRHGGRRLCNNHSCVEIPSLVHQTNITLGGRSCAVAEESQSATPPTTYRQCPSHTESFPPGSLPFIREIFQSSGFSEDIIDVIIASWRSGTRRQYAVYLRKWAVLCTQRQKNPVSPSPQIVVEFLQTLYDSSLSYSSLSVARSALASMSFAQGNTVGPINGRTPPYLPIS